METFSTLLDLSVGNSPVTGEFPSQRPVTRNFDVFFDLRLNKRLSKQSSGWLYETPSRSLWRHCNDNITIHSQDFVVTFMVLNTCAVHWYCIIIVIMQRTGVTTSHTEMKRSWRWLPCPSMATLNSSFNVPADDQGSHPHDLSVSEQRPEKSHPKYANCLILLASSWASYQIRKIAGCACAGNAGNVFPATDFKGNR